jgi:hypothetical protein
VIKDVPKTLVYELARYGNRVANARLQVLFGQAELRVRERLRQHLERCLERVLDRHRRPAPKGGSRRAG